MTVLTHSKCHFRNSTVISAPLRRDHYLANSGKGDDAAQKEEFRRGTFAVTISACTITMDHNAIICSMIDRHGTCARSRSRCSTPPGQRRRPPKVSAGPRLVMQMPYTCS